MSSDFTRTGAWEAERSAMQASLRSSEARFRNMIEKNADGVLVIDRGGLIRYVNPAAEVLLCRDAVRLIGSPFGIPILPGETTELDLPCPEADSRIIEMRNVETEWEGQPAYLASLRDVTDRKRSEDAIRQAEERYRRISEAISDFTYSFRVSDDGRLTLEWLTDAFLRVTGYSAAEAQSIGWARLIYPDDLDRAREHIDLVLSGESDRCELRIVTGSGEVRWLRNSAAPCARSGEQLHPANLRGGTGHHGTPPS